MFLIASKLVFSFTYTYLELFSFYAIVLVFRIVGLKSQTEVCLASILAATIYQTMQPEDLHIVQIYLYVDTVGYKMFARLRLQATRTTK